MIRSRSVATQVVADPNRPKLRVSRVTARRLWSRFKDKKQVVQGRNRRLIMVLNETEVVQSKRVKPRFYSLDDEILLQSLLTTLANLDFAYEQERERVSSSTNDANLRARVLQKLRDQHRERRNPYIQHLTVLHKQIMPQAQCS